jgi:peptide/nickel transport system permease protein
MGSTRITTHVRASRKPRRHSPFSLFPGILACVTVILAVFIAIIPEALATHDPNTQDIANRLIVPGSDFLLGSDHFGRDVFSRIIHGFHASITIGIASVCIGTLFGLILGSSSSYIGGWVDMLAQRVTDVLLGFPILLIAVVLIAAFGVSEATITIAISTGFTPHVTRLTQILVARILTQQYVTAAISLGLKNHQVLIRHVLPACIGTILAYSTSFISTALVIESSLSFLGLGVPPPDPSWGNMLQEGSKFLESAPWLVIFPAITLVIAALNFVVLGDFVRNTLDRYGATYPLH